MGKNNSDPLGCIGIVLFLFFICGLPWTLIPVIIVGVIIWLWQLIFGKKDIPTIEEKRNKNVYENKEKRIIVNDDIIHPKKIVDKVVLPKIELPQFNIDKSEPILIEEDSLYANDIAGCVNLNFAWIRQYAMNHLNTVSSPLKDRGERPLNNCDELNQYMYSYGNMHYAKMKYAINRLSWKLSNMDIDVIDWGCGQGIAIMTLLEVLRPKSIAITLIEPSILSLKRACLNTKYFHKTFSLGDFKCRTINKSFDSLNDSDIETSINTKIHLFSNVLDITDGYSHDKLIDIILRTQKGVNYFICVSPYRDLARIRKIDQFVDSFKMYNNFQILCNVNTSKDDDFWECNTHFRGIYCRGECKSCSNKWTKIVRVFSVNL